jgi:hypothetical protein
MFPMLTVSPEAFLLVPLALSVVFLVWVLFQIEKDIRRRR